MSKHYLTWIAAAGLALALSGCDVEQTEQAEAPEIDVQGGELPSYDVETGDVDVGTEERTVQVPTVDVETPEEEQASENGQQPQG